MPNEEKWCKLYNCHPADVTRDEEAFCGCKCLYDAGCTCDQLERTEIKPEAAEEKPATMPPCLIAEYSFVGDGDDSHPNVSIKYHGLKDMDTANLACFLSALVVNFASQYLDEDSGTAAMCLMADELEKRGKFATYKFLLGLPLGGEDEE